MNTVNILSVDFDWIMEPSIGIYNPLIKTDHPIDDLMQENPGCIFQADLSKFNTLNTYLANICRVIELSERIQFATHHDSIVDCIENCWKLTNVKYNIYNIDHHHDCGYEPTLNKIYEQKITCGNWVQYCKQLNSYTWINNKNSDDPVSDELVTNVPKFKQSNDIQLIGRIPFDYVFICLSPAWVPKQYHPLFSALECSIANLFEKESLVLARQTSEITKQEK